MKLNQIIALVQGKKTRVSKMLTDLHHGWKLDKTSGINRVYQPKDEDGEVFPPESRHVQMSVKDALTPIKKELADFYNIIATQETGNTTASADVKVAGNMVLSCVPVSALLFLEKQLIDLRTLAVGLPVLPDDKEWSYDEHKGCYVSKTEKTLKTQKKVEPIVRYEATKEHPAQTDLVNVDKTVGSWSTTHLSGAFPKDEKLAIIDKVEKLQDAVKVAREEANCLEVSVSPNFGESVMDYIFTSE